MKKSLGAKIFPLPAPVWVIGSYDAAGRPNMMTAAWAGICCSDPPCLSVSLRKATYSYHNLLTRQAFTVNLPSAKYVKVTDYFGLASGRSEDKIARAGLTAVHGDYVDAPYLLEFPVAMECQVLHVFELGLHTQFVGELKDVKIDEDALGPSGYPDVEKLDLFVLIDGYRTLGHYLAEPFVVGKGF